MRVDERKRRRLPQPVVGRVQRTSTKIMIHGTHKTVLAFACLRTNADYVELQCCRPKHE